MTVRATLGLENSRDERRAARKTLRLIATGRRANRQTTEVSIHDLSEGGMLIESAQPLQIGETISVEFPHKGLREAAVVWSSSRFYGCRFSEPLPSAVISAALLKARPVAGEASALTDAPSPSPASGEFGPRLTALRERHGLSIGELAARLGVSRQALWYWETGQRVPRRTVLGRIAQELGISERDLVPAGKDVGEGPTDLQSCKELIAGQCGVAIEKVKITIEL
jgi:transcriptional regulator with XRE-family HTH domain